MKKIAIITSGVLLSAGIGMHAAHYCPLQDVLHAQKTAAAAPAPVTNEAKPGTVTLR